MRCAERPHLGGGGRGGAGPRAQGKCAGRAAGSRWASGPPAVLRTSARREGARPRESPGVTGPRTRAQCSERGGDSATCGEALRPQKEEASSVRRCSEPFTPGLWAPVRPRPGNHPLGTTAAQGRAVGGRGGSDWGQASWFGHRRPRPARPGVTQWGPGSRGPALCSCPSAHLVCGLLCLTCPAYQQDGNAGLQKSFPHRSVSL